MAIVHLNRTDEFVLGVWRVEEDEETLKGLVGGDYFPGLARISHPRRRLEWLAARTLLRQFGYTGLVMYHPTRRPFLAHSRAHISISHSYPFVSVVMSDNFLVGVDVESWVRPFEQVKEKYLSVHEKLWVDPDDNRRMALIWSAKEAIYKLPGMEGLGGPEMDIKQIVNLSDSGTLKATVRLGGTVQHFDLFYYYMGYYNVVWVCCNPKVLKW
jgi:phosphopantetheinyl transferase (holo-ACP synthase)